MNNQTIKKILGKIKRDKIKPTEKWIFVLKNSITWLIGALTIAVGAIATSIVIFLIKFDFGPAFFHLGKGKSLIYFPFLWLVILVFFIFLTYFNHKHTEKGYRHEPYLIVIIALLISIILGALLFITKSTEQIESKLQRKMPGYHQLSNLRGKEWAKLLPNHLSGTVTTKIKTDHFELDSFKNGDWEIKIDNLKFPLPPEALKPGARLIILGGKINDHTLEAEKIIPWVERSNLLPMKQKPGFKRIMR